MLSTQNLDFTFWCSFFGKRKRSLLDREVNKKTRTQRVFLLHFKLRSLNNNNNNTRTTSWQVSNNSTLPPKANKILNFGSKRQNFQRKTFHFLARLHSHTHKFRFLTKACFDFHTPPHTHTQTHAKPSHDGTLERENERERESALQTVQNTHTHLHTIWLPFTKSKVPHAARERKKKGKQKRASCQRRRCTPASMWAWKRALRGGKYF